MRLYPILIANNSEVKDQFLLQSNPLNSHVDHDVDAEGSRLAYDSIISSSPYRKWLTPLSRIRLGERDIDFPPVQIYKGTWWEAIAAIEFPYSFFVTLAVHIKKRLWWFNIAISDVQVNVYVGAGIVISRIKMVCFSKEQEKWVSRIFDFKTDMMLKFI